MSTLTPTAVVKAAESKWDFALGNIFDISSVGVTTGAAASAAGSAESDAISKDLSKRIAAEQKTYTRPNGMPYVPRSMKVEGKHIHDVTFIQMAAANKMPVLLYGDPGTGKTAVFEAALPDLITVQGTIETETADLVGSWTQQPDGTYKWIDGPLVIAAEEGRNLLVDEIALIDSRVMAVAYGLMDGRNELVVTANPERGVVKAAPGFMIFGACNPDVPGAVMSDALLSRFQFHIEVGTDWNLTKKLGIDARIVQVARNLNIKKRDHAVTAAPQLRELLTYQEVLTTFGEEIALKNFVAASRSEDRPTVVEAIESVYGRKVGALQM